MNCLTRICHLFTVCEYKTFPYYIMPCPLVAYEFFAIQKITKEMVGKKANQSKSRRNGRN
jgi:hypothetical protein